jgi:hypothetical protein
MEIKGVTGKIKEKITDKDIPGKVAETIKEKVLPSIDTIEAKLQEWRDQYKKATAVLETFGFQVEKVSLNMVPPEINSSFLGSIENIREEKLRNMIEEHKAETLLVAMLKMLIMTRWVWEHMEPRAKSVTLHLTLGILPHVKTELK